MKTEQAIRKLGQTLWDILGREYIDKYCEDKNGNLVSVSSISVDEIAEELDNAGYGNIKQAKIEVLNKVKERAIGLAAIETYHICNLIDELIKEVQNGEDKS